MGKIEKQIQAREQEKHITTEEYIDKLRWYIRESENIRREFIKAQADLNDAFNAALREIAK